MSSVRYQELQEILGILRNMTFNPESGDDCDQITQDRIVFRKVSVADRDINQGKVFEQFPMILVSTPFEEPFAESLGEVAHDEYQYRFLIQIIDSDNYEPTRNINTYWAWQEKICCAFQFYCFKTVDAQRVMSNATNVDVVDERYWLKFENFKAGVSLVVRTWLTRECNC